MEGKLSGCAGRAQNACPPGSELMVFPLWFQGPPGPQGPIGYPGPRGVKVRFGFPEVKVGLVGHSSPGPPGLIGSQDRGPGQAGE